MITAKVAKVKDSCKFRNVHRAFVAVLSFRSTGEITFQLEVLCWAGSNAVMTSYFIVSTCARSTG